MTTVLGILLFGLFLVACVYFIVQDIIRKETTVQNTYDSELLRLSDYEPDEGYFSLAELQQLKSLLNTKLFNMEQQRLQCKAMARNFKLKGEPEVAGVYYKEAEKYTESIKKVGNLQHKIKHRIQSRGFDSMGFLVPELPEAVAQIWDDCGTTIESPNCTVGEKELEFFLERLIVAVGKAVHGLDYNEDVIDYLISTGYLDEGYHV